MNFKEYVKSVKESVMNINRGSLDPTVFELSEDKHPILFPSIKAQILMGIKEIEKIIPVEGVYLVGSILTNKYDKNSDIDITVQIDSADLDSIALEGLLQQLKLINGKLATGTTHPINYHITQSELNGDNFNAIYDIPNDKWLKFPKESKIDVTEYLSRFTDDINNIIYSTDHIRRNILDIEDIKELPKSKIENLKELLQTKLDEINTEAETLTTTYKNIKHLRKLAFDRYMTPEEIRRIGNKNNLPENIIYKFLQRYYFNEFISNLDELLQSKDIDVGDITHIKNMGKKMWR